MNNDILGIDTVIGYNKRKNHIQEYETRILKCGGKNECGHVGGFSGTLALPMYIVIISIFRSPCLH